MTASKDRIILIGSLHLKVRSVSYLSISRPLKWRSQEYFYLRKIFHKLLSKHILLNTFK